MIIEKITNPFKMRVMIEIKSKLIPITILILGIIIGRSNYLIVGILLGAIGILFWRIVLWNICFITRLELNEREIRVTYFKFNETKKIQIQLKNIDVKITPVHVIEKKYKLKLYRSGKMILKQFEIGDWSESDFNSVKEEIVNLKLIR